MSLYINGEIAYNQTSGVYTPSITEVNNIASSSAQSCKWLRIGNIVVVIGSCYVDFTAGGVSSSIKLSLPITSNFSGATDCNGSVSSGGYDGAGTFASHGVIVADVANDTALVNILPDTGDPMTLGFNFIYRVI